FAYRSPSLTSRHKPTAASSSCVNAAGLRYSSWASASADRGPTLRASKTPRDAAANIVLERRNASMRSRTTDGSGTDGSFTMRYRLSVYRSARTIGRSVHGFESLLRRPLKSANSRHLDCYYSIDPRAIPVTFLLRSCPHCQQAKPQKGQRPLGKTIPTEPDGRFCRRFVVSPSGVKVKRTFGSAEQAVDYTINRQWRKGSGMEVAISG